MQELLILTDSFQPLLQLHDHPLVLLVHLVKLEGLPAEPVPFLLHIDEPGFLLGLDSFDWCLFFEIAHVFLDDVHFLLEGCEEILLMLIDDALDRFSGVLSTKSNINQCLPKMTSKSAKTYIDLLVQLGIVIVYLPCLSRIHIIDYTETWIILLRQECLVLLLVEVSHRSGWRLSFIAVATYVACVYNRELV